MATARRHFHLTEEAVAQSHFPLTVPTGPCKGKRSTYWLSVTRLRSRNRQMNKMLGLQETRVEWRRDEVFVSCGCHTSYYHLGSLKNFFFKKYSLTVLQTRSLKSRFGLGHTPCGGSREECLQLLVAVANPWLIATSLQSPSSCHMAFSSVSVSNPFCLSLIRTLIEFRAHLNNPG